MNPRRRKDGSVRGPHQVGGLLVGYSDGVRGEVYRVTGTLEVPVLTLVAAASAFDDEYSGSLRVRDDSLARSIPSERGS